MTTTTDTYLFERRADLGDLEQRRLHALAALFDPATRRLLTEVGVARGSRCLEVAAGTGSVAAWLADQVGPEGEVYATDIDLTHLGQLPPNVTYAQHDIVEDPLPDGAFDVVHTRLLLEHLTGRETALNRMATAVRPGGYVLVEEAEMSPQALDLIGRYQPLAGREARTQGAARPRRPARGGRCGHGVCVQPAERGPTGRSRAVGGEIHSPLVRGGAVQDFGRLTFMVCREPLVASGLMTHDEIDAFLRSTLDPDSQYVPFVMTSVWARRPA